MGTVGALHRSFELVRFPGRRAAREDIISIRLNLQLPQRERILGDNILSASKNYYMPGAMSRLGQEPQPTSCGIVTDPEASVKVVGNCNV